jgi:integrase/recombinase XerD
MNTNQAEPGPDPASPDAASDLVALFLESLRVRGYSASTIASRRESLALFTRFVREVGAGDVREVTQQTVRDYQVWLTRRYAIRSVHVHLIALRQFFAHLEATGAILMSPCAGLVLPKLDQSLPRNVLTPDEARRVLEAPEPASPQGIRDRAILELFYSTGLRLEEMARLTVPDVDTRNGFARVTRGKFAKDRVVPAGSQACHWVRQYLDQVRGPWTLGNRDERALWLTTRKPHAPLKAQMIAVLVRQYGQRSGIDRRLSPHVWRHTCATHLLSGGGNIAYVQRLLGHRSLETTQRYTRVTIPELKAAHTKAHPRARVADPSPS